MTSNALAVVFALLSALTIAWGTVVRHRIAEDAPRDVLATAIRRPLWWAGTATAVVGYALQVVALGFGTLLIVQPVLVLSLMFTLPLSAWYVGKRMSSSEVVWSLALTAAVAVLVTLGRPSHGVVRPALHDWVTALSVGLATIATLTVLSYFLRRERAVLLGCVTGIVYGYVAVLSKAVVDIFTSEGLGVLVGSWEFWALVCGAGTGTIVQQYSFHAGPLTHSLPAMTIVEPIVAFALGYTILYEKFQVSSALGWGVMAASLVIMFAATVILSRSPLGTPTTRLDGPVEHGEQVAGEPRTTQQPSGH